MPVQRLSTGIDLYYEMHGRGEPLVLVPSTAFGGDVWLSDQVPALAESLQVVVFDPRGVGRSSHPPGVYTIEQMAADVVALLDLLGLRRRTCWAIRWAAASACHGARLPRPREESHYGRQRLRPRRPARRGLRTRPALPPGVRPGRSGASRRSCATRSRLRHLLHRRVPRAPPDRVQEFYDLAWRTHAHWPEYLRADHGAPGLGGHRTASATWPRRRWWHRRRGTAAATMWARRR